MILDAAKQEALVRAIKRWSKRGYCASAIGTALGLHRVTVARLGVVAGVESFGPIRLPAAYQRDLGRSLDIPPNLRGQYDMFLRQMEANPHWAPEELLHLVHVSEARITQWLGFWNRQGFIRNKLRKMDYRFEREDAK